MTGTSRTKRLAQGHNAAVKRGSNSRLLGYESDTLTTGPHAADAYWYRQHFKTSFEFEYPCNRCNPGRAILLFLPTKKLLFFCVFVLKSASRKTSNIHTSTGPRNNRCCVICLPLQCLDSVSKKFRVWNKQDDEVKGDPILLYSCCDVKRD